MTQSEKGDKRVVIIIMIVVAIFGGIMFLGCGAAIAIPAFVKYLQESKSAEATAVTQQIADHAARSFEEDCEFPPSLPPSADPASCCGGAKCSADSRAQQQWEAAGFVPYEKESYFTYETERVDASTYLIRATHDFECGGEMQTHEIRITGSETDGSCTAEVGSETVTNEFE
ncbi:MAG: hypothetical protein ACOCV2_12820 [Persicimonas sp.]